MLRASLRFARRFGCVVSVFTLGACAAGSAPDADGTSEGAVEVQDGDLWAGLTSYAIERYAPDPCDNGANRLDTQPIGYDEYARERATVRNVCFEVYKPGVTDRENPDFWKLLDVRVQYRFVGQKDWKEAFVNALDRRGNNRRYVWSLGLDLDPLYAAGEIGDLQAPFEITREYQGGVSIDARLEFTFTVNGHKLTNSKNEPFQVDYAGDVRVPMLDLRPNGHVLHADITCDGLKLGTGPGYFAADVTDPAAVAKFAPAVDGSLIPATRMGGNTAQGNAPTIVSFAFGATKVIPGEPFSEYYEETYNRPAKGQVRPQGGKMIVSFPAYDRATKAMKTFEATFGNCH